MIHKIKVLNFVCGIARKFNIGKVWQIICDLQTWVFFYR